MIEVKHVEGTNVDSASLSACRHVFAFQYMRYKDAPPPAWGEGSFIMCRTYRPSYFCVHCLETRTGEAITFGTSLDKPLPGSYPL